MQITLLGAIRNVEHEDTEPATSMSTGRPLHRTELTFRTNGDDMYDRVSDELRAAQNETPIIDAEGGRWRVESWSTSGSGQSPIEWQFTVKITQIEDVEVSAVEFLGHQFDVDFYGEHADSDDGYFVMLIEIDVRADQVPTLATTLWGEKNVNEFFDVSRAGVDDKPRRMRFGRVLWQALPEGRRRFQINFVSPPTEGEDSEAGNGPLFNQPEVANLERIAIEERARMRALIGELQSAGVLKRDAVERIAAAA